MPKNALVKVQGTQQFMNKQIPVVLGGFGENCKVVTDNIVAEIHNTTPREIRKSINRNIVRFKESVDFIDLKKGGDEITTSDLKSSSSDDTLFFNLGYTKQQIIQAQNIYLLSERGYAKLIKIMDTDLAWDVHDKLMDEYFHLREEQQNTYSHLSKELQAIFAIDHKQQEMDSRITKLENTMTIDYGQQKDIKALVAKKVISVLGGSDAPAYKNKTVSKKAFSQLHRWLRNVFEVNSYINIAVKDFERAKEIIPQWEPTEELQLMIKGTNAQMRLGA